MTFDVSMRLRLINEVSKEARKVEGDLEDIGDAARKLGNVRTGTLDRSLNEIGRKADSAGKDVTGLQRDLDKLGKVKINQGIGRQLDGMVKPADNLGSVMAVLRGAASGAFGALAAFASVDQIIRGLEQLSDKYRQLNRDVADVAITAEMRSPEAMAKISKSNAALSIRYGMDQMKVNAARKTFAAAGIGIDQQEAILDPTLKAAQASGTDGQTMAQAVVALQQNLGVKDADVPAALDMISKGTKLGQFEIGAIAKNFPKLASQYGSTGRSGLDAVAELVTLAQVTMKSAGSQDIAANNLDNIMGKLTSPDTVKNFADKGFDIETLKKKSEKNGTPYMTDLIDQVIKMTGGNEFRIGELFGDREAKMALRPLIDFRDQYKEWLQAVKKDSAGSVDLDWQFSDTLPQTNAQQREAALQATGDKLGGAWATVTDPARDRVTGWINPDFAKQEEAARRARLKALGPEELQRRISGIDKRIGAMPPELLDLIIPGAPHLRRGLRTEKQDLRSILSEITGEKVEEQESYPWKKLFFGAAGEEGFSLKEHLGVNLRGTAENAMQGYNEALAAEGEKAASEAQSIAERIKTLLGFTVSPTITPNFTPPAAAPAPAGEKHSSLQQSSNVRLTQNIAAPNPKLAALRSRREQGRAISQAQARSLYDIGRMPA